MNDPVNNPLANVPDLWPAEDRPPTRPDLRWKAIDARLGVEGLPQSATGQTALLTGVNAAQLLGRHLQGFPSKRLIEVLRQRSIFLKLKGCGLTVTFANAYRHPEDIKPASRLSVTSHALKASGESFRSIQQIAQGKALYHEFTNRDLRDRGYDIPLLSPKKAGEILISIAKEHDFTLYEHFMTDVLAHQGDKEAIEDQVKALSDFIRIVLKRADSEEMMVIITSDHGNVEDLSVKSHTRNPVPLIWTEMPDVHIEPIPDDICGVTSWILQLLDCTV